MENLPRLVRKFVFDHFLEHAGPPVLEEVMQKFGLSRLEAADVLKELEAGRHVVLLRGTQRILMAHPFSSIPTPFKVTLENDRRYFANCSWDSIAFHIMLGENVRVDSFCHHCGEDVDLELSEQNVASRNPGGVLVYFGTPAKRWWDDVIDTCSNNMTFFASRRHLDEWLAANSGQGGEALTPEQVLKLSVPIYKDKMRMDYARPSKDELSAHFESLGLCGEFWDL